MLLAPGNLARWHGSVQFWSTMSATTAQGSPFMNPESQRALLTLALFAAFADGHKADSEREAIRNLADSLADDQGGHPLASLYQDVLLKRVTVQGAVAALREPEHRQLAYEMAVCVCDADGSQSAAEQQFLADLRRQLGLEQNAGLRDFEAQADAVAAQTESAPPSWRAGAASAAAAATTTAPAPAQDAELDQGHIKEFIAAAGIGMTSQYIEQFGRKLLGGLIGKALGRTMGKVGGAATGMAFSFATTYALWQLAKRYYAGGRVMDAALLRSTYQSLLGPAQNLQTQYLPQIQQRASTLDAGQIMALVKGS